MSVSSFKSAHQLITGKGAAQELSGQLIKLGVENPFIVTDKGVSNSGTLTIITDQLSENSYAISRPSLKCLLSKPVSMHFSREITMA